jgi:hypothetical protein
MQSEIGHLEAEGQDADHDSDEKPLPAGDIDALPPEAQQAIDRNLGERKHERRRG